MKQNVIHNRSRLLAVIAGLLLIVPSKSIFAVPITINFTGTVNSVSSSLGGTFSGGQTLTGSYTFDSSIGARAGSTSSFAVFDALQSLSFSIGGYSASSLSSSEIQVDNDPGLPFNDRYAVVSRASQGLSGAMVGGFALDAFAFRLDDSTNSVFSDALVLPTSLSLSSFDSTAFFLFFVDTSGALQLVDGAITGLSTVSQVPEPSTLVLLLLGLVGVQRFCRHWMQQSDLVVESL
ncbi:MAG: PEP-CTERM sorting domain-containing protein [Methylococcaceae bacterium]|nr:PEP-CTERM sorting domain-containing protein [Methylococcaceae bacterium]